MNEPTPVKIYAHPSIPLPKGWVEGAWFTDIGCCGWHMQHKPTGMWAIRIDRPDFSSTDADRKVFWAELRGLVRHHRGIEARNG